MENSFKPLREDWADIAKAFSIILLVSWHAEGFHWLFSYLRMPLFFLVSGYFARSAIYRADQTKFYRDKLGNMVYLYVLWSFIITVCLYIFADKGRVAYHMENLLQIFWQPLPTLWFIYALALAFLISRIIRSMPFVPVLVVSLLLYFVVEINLSGNVGFADKLVKLFPFFWIGLKSQELISKAVGKIESLFPFAFVVYFIAAWFGQYLSEPYFGPFYFLVALIGIFAIAGMSQFLCRFSFAALLSGIGGATVYIYLMHRPALYYFNGVVKKLGLDFVGLGVIKVAVVVLACYYLGKWMRNTKGLRHLLSAPWAARKIRVMK
ncbi:acyltransferase family protein [Salinimonas chungwhensis]|uniref:acyltransferase family protein n=1 Tax=Salinimonas chungwhensis TaxID=265425 RepID=UPI00037E0932|nr:acyltransferase family protein [Salinimonas chungwhensis]